MNDGLQMLLDLQNLDLKIADLAQRAADSPMRIGEIDEALEENQRELDALRERVDQQNRERKLLEGDVELQRQRLSKYKDQLMSVKTNKEYQAVLHEIASTEEEIARTEDRILECMLAADEGGAEAVEIERKLKAAEKEMLERRRGLEQFAEEAEREIGELRSRRGSLVGSIPEELIQLYDRIASVRQGVVMAEVRDQSCQLCHVRLRPQLYNEIKTNRRIATCENCNRILFYAG